MWYLCDGTLDNTELEYLCNYQKDYTSCCSVSINYADADLSIQDSILDDIETNIEHEDCTERARE